MSDDRKAALTLSHPRYEPGPVLGQGAQGLVLRVVDRENPAKPLVAKIWRGAADAGASAALAGEFALLSRARITGLVRAHDFGHDQLSSAIFLVEDFVPGEDASQWLCAAPEPARSGRLSSLLGQVGTTLGALHALGLTHGDLKPAHVRFDRAGRSTLLDLGSAVTHAAVDMRVLITTPAYAAPELLAGGRPSIASDMYGLGALVWKACSGRTPDPQHPRSLRELAPWLHPSLAAVVERLVAPHPSDRPDGAQSLLRLIGSATELGNFSGDARLAPVGREAIFERLASPVAQVPGRVRYLVGASGTGKSHLARALLTATLVRGAQARFIGFADGGPQKLDALLAFLRGDALRSPFAHEGTPEDPMLLVLDDLDRAPLELHAALDLFRCRAVSLATLEILVTAREAPAGAESIELAPLGVSDSAALVAALGVEDAPTAAELVRSAAGNPGWLVAALGRVPLSREAVLARTKALLPASVELLAAIALVGGALGESVLERAFGPGLRAAAAELFCAALVTRRKAELESVYALLAPGLADDIALALGSFSLVNRLASALLAEPQSQAQWLLKLARAPNPPQKRSELLHAAAARGRAGGLHELEMDALFGLAADPREQTGELLLRLERLTRDSGRTGVHPQVLLWLEDRARRDLALLPLMLRRKAETLARAGDHARARGCAEEALAAVSAVEDRAQLGLVYATLGAIALYRADWSEAESRFAIARSLLPLDFPDEEEAARLLHNTGVVALYREHAEDAKQAFEAALAKKRALGDRAGVRACLLNLGLALTKLDRLDEADRALLEARALAESLGQVAGRAWCLAALADVALRRGRARTAERLIAEAEAARAELPALVQADLKLLRAGVALLDRDGRRALQELLGIADEVRQNDALIDGRAALSEARAHLLLLPVDRLAAARLALRAIRRARAGKLSELARQAEAVLRAARRTRAAHERPRRYHQNVSTEGEAPLWALLQRMAAGLAIADAGFELARVVVTAACAERAFVVLLDQASEVAAAFGADIDGFAVADAGLRLPMDDLRAALLRLGPLHLREVETKVGHGSRLCIASLEAQMRAVIVVEHRSLTGCFDRLAAETVQRWAALGGLLARFQQAGVANARAPALQTAAGHAREASAAPDSVTVVPLRTPGRDFPSILGQSEALAQALARLDAAVDSELPVLLVGETGTGKELFARALHEHGARAHATFLAVNCAAIADALFEAELFGHVRGSFTGAEHARSGLLARAEGGTLLLDEIGELPLGRQAALLRALETRCFRPVGSDEERSFNVRVVAATNRDLARAVEEGAFRRDLLFRLNVIEIRVPPLRERAGDVMLLAERYLRASGSRARLASSAVDALQAYAWPGNVRELKHLFERLLALRVAAIERKHLPRALRRAIARPSPVASTPELERARVEQALEVNAGNISRAAKQLGLTRHGLKKKMLRLGLRPLAQSEEGR